MRRNIHDDEGDRKECGNNVFFISLFASMKLLNEKIRKKKRLLIRIQSVPDQMMNYWHLCVF
jgi:hypothetical protein